MSISEKRLLLTGASGLLGRAIYKEFRAAKWTVYGTALSRVGPGLHKLNLSDKIGVEKAVAQFNPIFVIHCAAQRYPDKVDSDPDSAIKLNVEATKHLAQIAQSVNAPVLYISTDYVFDGKSPPYTTYDEPNPINMYGKTKYQGEKAALDVNKDNLVLRIPVIYGPVDQLAESAVTVLLENLMNSSNPSEVSNYERRCPSHVNDIAEICYKLVVKRLEDPQVSGIFHWCGKEVFTKYTMILQMAEVFNLPCNHIKAMSGVPTSSTVRPFDTMLDTSRLEELNINVHTPFKVGIHDVLSIWVKHYPLKD